MIKDTDLVAAGLIVFVGLPMAIYQRRQASWVVAEADRAPATA